MRAFPILTPILIALGIALAYVPNLFAQPQVRAQRQTQLQPSTEQQEAFEKMRVAFVAKNSIQLTKLLSTVSGHPMQRWAEYWELSARLKEASSSEVDTFLKRHRGFYHEDRLRNDWLLVLGERADWKAFVQYLSHFRMNDDPQVKCYALLIDSAKGQTTSSIASEILNLWYAQNGVDKGCTLAVQTLHAQKIISDAQVWHRARLGTQSSRTDVVQAAVKIVAPQALPYVRQVLTKPQEFLQHKQTISNPDRSQLIPFAVAALANSNAEAAAGQAKVWSEQFTQIERDWVWGAIGRVAGIRLSPNAMRYFNQVKNNKNLLDEQLLWKARAALRAGDSNAVLATIESMPADMQSEPVWVYWKARILDMQKDPVTQSQAQQLMQSIAGLTDFYPQLASLWLGGLVLPTVEPMALTPSEINGAQNNPRLQHAIESFRLGFHREGVREWNYAISLHDAGGMADRELFAAADLACKNEIWDRCINTSARAKSFISFNQRYPMPFYQDVVQRTKEVELDPAYVYGLIRQESRFIMDARSSVGASGLMQIMPATAKWTAKKIGLTNFSPSMLNDKNINITIGTAYLKLAMDEFSGSMPLSAAAYNAGPNRPRRWRNDAILEAAIWAENIPFNETREYVQNVLANATVYGAIISGTPQSLESRLGKTIGPPEQQAKMQSNMDLP